MTYCVFGGMLNLAQLNSGPAFCYPGNLVPYFPVVSVGLWSIWSSLVLHSPVLHFQSIHMTCG